MTKPENMKLLNVIDRVRNALDNAEISVNSITHIPDGFQEWVNENMPKVKRILRKIRNKTRYTRRYQRHCKQ